jgi:manganese transport protein
MWLLSEGAAMATDLAEFLGAALGIALMTHLSLMVSLIITATITLLILHFIRSGFRMMEYVIALFIAVIGMSYLIELLIAPPQWAHVARGLMPSAFDSHNSVMLAVGIIGATVMPHALYLHSNLTQNRIPAGNDDQRKKLIAFSHREIMCALGLAGLINLAMVIMSANVFHPHHQDIADVATAYQTLAPLLGTAAASLFLIALIASGLSSSVVGTLAGQYIMQDFIAFSIPLWLRRLITMLPAFGVVYMGYGVTDALVISQVILSLLLPIPMCALIYLCAQRKVMGAFASSIRMSTINACATLFIVLLNALLIKNSLWN